MTNINVDAVQSPENAKPKANAKDRKVLAKSSSIARELGALSRDNARAFAASSKIALRGLTDLGRTNLGEAEIAFSQFSDDLKGLSAVQSPIDFYKLQGALLRSSFNAAFAFTTRNRETLVKLTEEAAAPLREPVQTATTLLGKRAA